MLNPALETMWRNAYNSDAFVDRTNRERVLAQFGEFLRALEAKGYDGEARCLLSIQAKASAFDSLYEHFMMEKKDAQQAGPDRTEVRKAASTGEVEDQPS